MKRRNNIGVKWKIFFYVSVYTLVFIAALWLLQIVFIKNIYGAVKRAEIKAAATETEKYIPDLDKVKSAAESQSKKRNICFIVYVVDPDGVFTTVCSCESSRECAIHSLDEAGIRRIYDITRTSGKRTLATYRFNPEASAFLPSDVGIVNDDEPESIVLSEVFPQGDYSIFVLLNSFVTPLASTVSIINVILVIISAFMIIMALFLSFALSGNIVRPISRINESAKALAAGNYNVEFSGKGYREINELSDTLNYTSRELAKVDMLKRELIANTSHDLRTPLTMIGGYAEMMRDIPGENTPENAEIILRETERMTSLVNDMLDISKLESGTQSVNEEVFSLTQAVSDTVTRYTRFNLSQGYKISFYADADVTVKTDRSKYLQAFCNLMNNALTYTGADKKINVVQSIVDGPQSPLVRFSVIDTGEGIPEDKLPLIWERYYKITSEHKRSQQGSGLGLSIVKKIMDLLGGSCGVISKVGEGSSFHLDIPIYFG